MRLRLYFAVLMSTVVLISCEKDNKPNQDPDTPVDTKLATPRLTVSPAGELSFVVSWESVDNADYYTYRINNTGERTTEETQVLYSNLNPGEYVVEVRAEAEEGSQYESSSWGSITYVLELDPAVIPSGWEKWLGSWTITTDSTMIWVDNPDNPGTLIPDVVPEPKTMQVDITYDGSSGEPFLLMAGWSDYTDTDGSRPPVWCQVDEETGRLCLLNGIEIGFVPSGETLNWYAYCGNIGTLDAIWAYCITLDGDEGVGEAMMIEWNDPSIPSSQIRAFDIFMITSMGGFLPVNDESPAGDFVMVRNSGSEEASR